MSNTKIIPDITTAKRLSTNSDIGFLRANFLGITYNRFLDALDIEQTHYDIKETKPWVEPLKLARILKFNKIDMQQVEYDRSKTLPGLCNSLYGTTSVWWIILHINGYSHPDEIPDKTKLWCVKPTPLKTALSKLKEPGLKGKTVIV